MSEKQITYDVTYVWNLTFGRNEPIYKTETDSQTTENRPAVAKWEGYGRDGVGGWGQKMQTSTYRMDKQGSTI